MHSWVGVHKKISLRSCLDYFSSAQHVLLILHWRVYEIGDKCPYNCFFVDCCFQDLFKIVCSILLQFPSSFFSRCFINIEMVHPFSCTNTNTAWKKSCFILSERSTLHMIDNLTRAVHAVPLQMLTSLNRWNTVAEACKLVYQLHLQ